MKMEKEEFWEKLHKYPTLMGSGAYMNAFLDSKDKETGQYPDYGVILAKMEEGRLDYQKRIEEEAAKYKYS